MTPIDCITNHIDGISADQLRELILLSCKSDKTEATTRSIWATCLTFKPTQSKPIEGTKTPAKLACSSDTMKIIRVAQVLREFHKELASLAYKVLQVYESGVPPTILSSIDTGFIDKFENQTDRERDLRLFARGVEGLLARGSEVLGQVQGNSPLSTQLQSSFQR